MKEEARVQALGALYAADVLRQDVVDVDRLSARAARLAEGTWQHRAALDARIGAASTGWRVERMPAVDRTILRLGAYELTETETPAAVVISEAVQLAKQYSTARSGPFVNGVLATIATGGATGARDDPDV